MTQLDLFRVTMIQLDLFRVVLPPCGRSSSPLCVVETSSAGLRCPRCGCVAPAVTVASNA
jgi:hypothetical protein